MRNFLVLLFTLVALGLPGCRYKTFLKANANYRTLRAQLEENLAVTPEIVSTNQGSQFAAIEFTEAVLVKGCRLCS